MGKLLHIVATPRGEDSRTLQVSKAFLASFRKHHPDWLVEEFNVCAGTMPSLTVKVVQGKYVLMAGGEMTGAVKEAWRDVEQYIRQFLSADLYLVSTPMWNFSIPYFLKQYIDIIVQPRYLFRYTEKGPEGLVKNKKMVVITSRGGDYGPASPFHAYDMQEPYLRTVFGFVGLTDITFIYAQPMDAMGVEIQKKKLEEAEKEAEKIALTVLEKV